MSCRATLATATLLLAATLQYACSQTAQHIPLESPKPKGAEPAKKVALDSPRPKAAAEQPREVGLDAPKLKELKPAEPAEVVEGPPDEIPPPRSFAPEPKLDRVLEQRLRDLAKEHHGKVALYAWQLNTTRAVAIDAEQTVQTANAVKLALLWDSLRQISLGDTTWNEKLGNITLQDAFTRLTFTGDPAAATQLANRFTTHRVEEDMITLGYSGTWLPTHPNAAQTLAPGKTTPKQVVSLLQHIGMCDLDLPKQLHVNIPRSEMACRAAAGILRDKLYRDSIPEAPGSAPQGEGVLTKTLSTGRSDIAILAAKTGPIVLAVYTYDNAAGADQARSIADITKAILDAWSPDGTDAKVFDKTHLGVSWE